MNWNRTYNIIEVRLNKIKIYHFNNGSGGGVLSVIRNLLKFSSQPNIENHVIYTINLDLVKEYRSNKIEGAVSEVIFYYSAKWNFYYTCRQLAKLLPNQKAVIVAHDWLELGMVSNLGLQNRVVQVVHGDYDYYYDLAKKHSQSIDSFITVAESIEKHLKTIIPERKQDIKYLRFPVPDNDCLGEKDEIFSIIFIGRCTEEKGYNLLPLIATILLDEGFKINWHIVGEADNAARIIYPWPAEAAVNFHGLMSNPDVQKLLCRMHILLLPSLGEGMPVAIIESMKAGVIPLVNDIPGGIQELISEGLTGFKIANNKIESYKKKIIWLMEHPLEQVRIVKNMKEYAATNFNPVSNTTDYETDILKAGSATVQKRKEKIYGSRLDQVWLANNITYTIRNLLKKMK